VFNILANVYFEKYITLFKPSLLHKALFVYTRGGEPAAHVNI